MTFSDRIDLLLSEKNEKRNYLAEIAGITNQSFTDWKKRGTIPSAETILKIANHFDVSMEWLLTGSGNRTLPSKSGFYVPFLNQTLSAGKGQLIPEDEQPENFIQVSEKLRKYKGHLAAIEVRGDSMEPTIHDGDIAICDNLGYDNSEGIYVVYLNNNGFIKRVQIGIDEILIKSDNPKYETIREPIGSQAIQIVGKLRAIIHVI